MVGLVGRSRTGRTTHFVESIGESICFHPPSVCVFMFVILVASQHPAVTVPERFLDVLGVLEEVHMVITPDLCGSPFAKDVVLVRMEIFHL